MYDKDIYKYILGGIVGREKDYMSEAKEAYNAGDYENAWCLAQKAMMSSGGAGDGARMMVDMVKEGIYKIDMEVMEEEPEIIVEDEEARAEVCIRNKTGICETPATILAGLANRFCCDIEIRERHHKADAKMKLMIECMGLSKGKKIEIWARGEDAEEAVRTLAKVITNRFAD